MLLVLVLLWGVLLWGVLRVTGTVPVSGNFGSVLQVAVVAVRPD